jgi:hypothetical protein
MHRLEHHGIGSENGTSIPPQAAEDFSNRLREGQLSGARRMEQVVASGYAAANGLKDRFLRSPQQSWLCYNTTRILSKVIPF